MHLAFLFVCSFFFLFFVFFWKGRRGSRNKICIKRLTVYKKKRKHLPLTTISCTSHKKFRVIFMCGPMKTLLNETKYSFNNLKLERCLK